MKVRYTFGQGRVKNRQGVAAKEYWNYIKIATLPRPLNQPREGC